jgi:hypothetical protein
MSDDGHDVAGADDWHQSKQEKRKEQKSRSQNRIRAEKARAKVSLPLPTEEEEELKELKRKEQKNRSQKRIRAEKARAKVPLPLPNVEEEVPFNRAVELKELKWMWRREDDDASHRTAYIPVSHRMNSAADESPSVPPSQEAHGTVAIFFSILFSFLLASTKEFGCRRSGTERNGAAMGAR